MTNCDALVVGGGFFGVRLALHLRARGLRVVVVEAERDILTRASLVNQARVHQGYHYPRSVLTALRSRVNFGRFVEEYGECVERSFEAYYAVARAGSKVTAAQFAAFCGRVGAPVRPAPVAVKRLFDARLIDDVFAVHEYAFDATRLRARLWEDLNAAGVEVRCAARATRVWREDGVLSVLVTSAGHGEDVVTAHEVIHATYSAMNRLLDASALPAIALTHELAELALVEVPEALRARAITVVDGPFFSLMPYPAAGLHSFTHVRYTPREEWHGSPSWAAHAAPGRDRTTAFAYMLQDAQRYLPALAGCRYVRSLWEVKTILPRSASDDSRPILLRRDHGLHGLTCVLGGKLDNVYDAAAELDQFVVADARAV